MLRVSPPCIQTLVRAALLLWAGIAPILGSPNAALDHPLALLHGKAARDASNTKAVHPAGLDSTGGVQPLVPVQTRVIPGGESHATAQGVQVGTRFYAAPPLANDANAGFHLVILSRQSLDLISNLSFSTNVPDLTGLAQALQSVASTNLVILDTLGTPGTIGNAGNVQSLILGLGGSTNGFFNSGLGTQAGVYSLIGNPGLNPGTAFERSNLINPQTSGSIQAILRSDVRGNYFPESPSFVALQTSAGPAQDVVMVGNYAIPAPALPVGVTSGFHLVALRADGLDQVTTNPAVVLFNQSYATGTSDSQVSDLSLAQLRIDLLALGTPVLSDQALVVLASFGPNPLPCNPGNCGNFNLLFIQGFIGIDLGGVGDLSLLQAGDYYSLVGIHWPGGTPLTVENRSWTLPASLNGTVNLTTLMHPNPQGWYRPVAADTVGGVDYRLFEIACQSPVSWPIAPNAGNSPCPSGDAECSAYQWISLQLTQGQDASIRNEYVVSTADFNTYVTSLSGLGYDPSQSNSFSSNVFSTVKTQLLLELKDVPNVQILYGKYAGLVEALALDQTAALIGTLGNVVSDVQAPTNATVALDGEGLLRFLIVLAGATIQDDPELKAALGVVNGLFYLGYSKNKDTAGNGQNVIVDAVSALANDIGTSFIANRGNVAVVFREILTDWGKLDTVAKLVNSQPSPGNGFAWEIGTTAGLVGAMTPSYTLGFYRALLPTRFQQVVFTNVSFATPDAYSYQDHCSISQYGTFCDCHNNVYQPPAFDYLSQPAPGSLYTIQVIATPDLQYPVGNLMTNSLPRLGVFMSDLFQGVGTWTGILTSVAPQGWSAFLNPVGGWCSGDLVPEPAKAGVFRVRSRGIPGVRYQLESSFTLDGNWIPAGEPVVAGADLMVLTSTAGVDGSFFRLRRLE